MASWKEMWDGLKREARVAIIIGTILIVFLAIWMVIWSFSTNYSVLFSNMEERDTAAVIAELERLGVDYELIDGSNQILIPENKVHQVRLQLMESGLPFQGGVGFEIFDNSDFGMTEFAQKINFQRALQGELTRTISSLMEVKYARVHLVMPENSLFKQNQESPQASVTLFMRKGERLNGAQILGIQRLVASSVPGLKTENVTIVDENGLTLTKVASAEEGSQTISGRLKKKKEVEEYLSGKIKNILQRVFNSNESVVSVDVSLNMDRIKSTREDVLPQINGKEAITRRRESKTNAGGKLAEKGTSSTTEVEYKLGRKIEQIVHMPGTIERLSVGILVPAGVLKNNINKIKDLVEAVVGFNINRGDVIAIHALDGYGTNNASKVVSEQPKSERNIDASEHETNWKSFLLRYSAWFFALIGILLIAVIALIWLFFLERNQRISRDNPLGAEEREKLLLQLKKWLDDSDEVIQEELNTQ
jgi:flagellar M-ring protein FliF